MEAKCCWIFHVGPLALSVFGIYLKPPCWLWQSDSGGPHVQYKTKNGQPAAVPKGNANVFCSVIEVGHLWRCLRHITGPKKAVHLTLNSEESSGAILLRIWIWVMFFQLMFCRFGLDLKNPNFVAYANRWSQASCIGFWALRTVTRKIYLCGVFLLVCSYGAKGYCVRSTNELSWMLHDCIFGSTSGVKLIEVLDCLILLTLSSCTIPMTLRHRSSRDHIPDCRRKKIVKCHWMKHEYVPCHRCHWITHGPTRFLTMSYRASSRSDNRCLRQNQWVGGEPHFMVHY